MEAKTQTRVSVIQQLLTEGKYLQAIREADRLETDQELERAEVLVCRTEAMLAIGDFEPKYLMEALAILNPSGEMRLFAHAKYLRARQLVVCGDHTNAHEHLMESFVSYKRIGDIRGMARTSNLMSVIAYQQGDFSRFFRYARRSLGYYEQMGAKALAGMVLSNMCSARVRMGDFTLARQELNRVAADYLDHLSEEHRYNYFHISVLMYSQTGDFRTAKQFLSAASDLRKDLKREVFRHHEMSAYMFLLAGNYDAAEEALNAGLQIALDTAPESSLMAQIKRLFGDLYVARELWDKAEQHTTEALAVAEKIQERAEIAACWRLQAQINQVRGRRDAARDRYRQAIELFAQIGSQWELALTRQLAGGSGLFDEGERLAQLALARDYFASEKITDSVKEIDRLLNPLRPTRTTGNPSEVPTIIAETEIMRDRLCLAEDVARSEMNVLLLGPTGTGKDLLARYIHHHSGREGEFVSVNAAAIPNSMIESELFGHKKGAFTGAENDRAGLFEQANGGTFYLNEIADASPEFQAKLLEVLETRSARRLGDNKVRPLTFRLIAACNYDLRKRAREGDFRVDLFHRLNQIPIELPPLSARLEDIKPLVRFFLSEVDPAVQHSAERLDRLAEILACFDYPGNVRELRSVVHRLAVTARGDMDRLIAQAQSWNGLTNDEFLRRLLSRSGGKRTEVARVLGVSATTVRNRLRKLGVEQDVAE